MVLLIGTSDGVYRSTSRTLNDVEKVLDSGSTLRVRTFAGHEGVFAATKNGLYRSIDDGTTWEDLSVPRTEVFSVVGSPDGTRLFAGTHPAHLYVSTDGGETWSGLEEFQELPSREGWHTPRHRNEAHVRSLGVHPDAPERVIAGVEVGGIHVSNDSGETWSERREGLEVERRGLQYDVHHVLVLGADEWVVSCGGGLYRTRDAGRSWTRLDADLDQTYFREAFVHDGRLYAAATRGPWAREVDAALFESVDGGDTLESVSYPGRETEFVLVWAAHNGNDGDVFAGTHSGRVLRRGDGEWTSVGKVPVRVRSLAVA